MSCAGHLCPLASSWNCLSSTASSQQRCHCRQARNTLPSDLRWQADLWRWSALEWLFCLSVLPFADPRRYDNPQVLAGNPLLPLSFVFANHLSSLWSLWELVALSEPIIVYGTDVPLVSAAVAWLTLLSKPITFAGDYRSSLNIHMHDYHRFVNANPPQKALFIGTTNPLVFSSCRHWPHFLRISPKSTSSTNSTSQHNSNHFKPHSSGSVFGLPNPTLKEAKGTSSFKAATESNNGLFSHHRRTIKKDHAVLKSAEESVKTGDYRSADATLLSPFRTLKARDDITETHKNFPIARTFL